MNKLIPAKLYRKIVELVPIVCVDVILIHEGKYILVKRKNEPLEGQWWVVGGRSLKGEHSHKTVIRKIREETGLKANNFQLRGVYEDHYKKSAWGVPTSSISLVYQAEVKDFNPKLDKTSSAIRLSELLPSRFSKKTIWIN